MAIINSETGCEEWWYLDTGCSNHMTGHKDWFCELDETVRRSIKFGDGRTVMAKGIGRVSIRRVDGRSILVLGGQNLLAKVRAFIYCKSCLYFSNKILTFPL